MKFVASVAWRSMRLIGIAAVLAAIVILVCYDPTAKQVWSGTARLQIGLGPSTDYIALSAGPPLTPLESPREAVARISDPGFRNDVANQAAFEPATVDLSRSMVTSSLRGVAIDDRTVAVELSAGSIADVRAAFAALTTEIVKAHAEILERRLGRLQARIDETKQRIALIEDSSTSLNERLISAWTGERTPSSDKAQSGEKDRSGDKGKPRPALAVPPALALTPAESLPVWNQLKDRLQVDTNLVTLSEPTVVRVKPDVVPPSSRSIPVLRASLLAGLAILMAMIVLTFVVNSPARS